LSYTAYVAVCFASAYLPVGFHEADTYYLPIWSQIYWYLKTLLKA